MFYKEIDTQKIKKETYLKAQILSRGVIFTDRAINHAIEENAKIQNLTYNMPSNAHISRPQELFIKSTDDGYTVVVSCVSPMNDKNAVTIDFIENKLIAIVDNIVVHNIELCFVKKPEYYDKTISNGEIVRKYISSCGYDELNILPWKGCSISKGCKFCGVNTTASKNKINELTANNITKNPSIWEESRKEYIYNLRESIEKALQDECFNEHAHVILISGNLSNDKLDLQTKIYCEITDGIKDLFYNKSSEGIVAVISPPNDLTLLQRLKDSGVDIVVFNLEVGNEPWFSKYCPGKSEIGRDLFIDALTESVKIFGYGKSWTNFVLGLEPIDCLLELCDNLAKKGIVPSANVLHLDEGHSLDCSVPNFEEVVFFFKELSKIYKKYNLKPYYCSKALRTSLSNEAFDNRF